MKREVIETHVNEFPRVVRCECGGQFELYFNGGELDKKQCDCGAIYSLEARAIELVKITDYMGGNNNAE